MNNVSIYDNRNVTHIPHISSVDNIVSLNKNYIVLTLQRLPIWYKNVNKITKKKDKQIIQFFFGFHRKNRSYGNAFGSKITKGIYVKYL